MLYVNNEADVRAFLTPKKRPELPSLGRRSLSGGMRKGVKVAFSLDLYRDANIIRSSFTLDKIQISRSVCG
jgi:hypothetical protein